MTYHSIERTRERSNIPKKAAARAIERAKQRGITASELPAKERRYLSIREDDSIKILYYSGYLYVIDSVRNICITMYRAPKWFLGGCNYMGKQKIRHPKKYARYYGYNEDKNNMCLMSMDLR